MTQLKTSVESNLNPVDFVEGLYDGAIKQPARAVGQLVDANNSAEETSKDAGLAEKAGNLAGSMI